MPPLDSLNGSVLFHQGGSDQSAALSQHSGSAVVSRQHLHHLLRGGTVPETGAGETGADAVGEERGRGAKTDRTELQNQIRSSSHQQRLDLFLHSGPGLGVSSGQCSGLSHHHDRAFGL